MLLIGSYLAVPMLPLARSTLVWLVNMFGQHLHFRHLNLIGQGPEDKRILPRHLDPACHKRTRWRTLWLHTSTNRDWNKKEKTHVLTMVDCPFRTNQLYKLGHRPSPLCIELNSLRVYIEYPVFNNPLNTEASAVTKTHKFNTSILQGVG